MAILLHVDMDAFFASVELLHHPEWRGKPLIVGSGPHERGVVSTCSYEARKFGVHSAMPSRLAYRLCPHAIFTPPRIQLYNEVSERVFEIFGHYSPFVEAVSIDEAFLEISGTVHLYGDASKLAEALRAEIRRECGVTCSVGIAPNRLMAKIGSEQNKPDGLTVMPFDADKISAFLADKPIDVLWGVGGSTVELLKPFGLNACGDIQRLPIEQLTLILGSRAAAESLKEYSFGRSSDKVNYEPEGEKSVSREYTFDEDEEDREAVRQRLLQLVEEVGVRFRCQRRWAATARIKVRNADFKTVTRQVQFEHPARDDIAFREKAMSLFDVFWPKTESCRCGTSSVRLIGFGVTNIRNSPESSSQMSLFDDGDNDIRNRRERLSDALDLLREKGLFRSGRFDG